MKILNIILCVFILLLAAASAAASYMLYEKRVQLVNGWGKMANAINQTAVKLEEKSGRKVSGDLSADELSHMKYAELDAKLEKLKALATDLIRQRNALAASLREAGMISEMPNLPQEAQLLAFSTSNASARQIVSGVNQLQARRNQLVTLISNSARRVNVSLSSKDLRSGDARSAFRKFDERVAGIQAQFTAYRNTLSGISELAGGSAVRLTEDNYAQELAKVTRSVTSLREQYNKAMENAKREQGKRLQTENTVKVRDGQIKTLRLSIASKDDEITQYRRALGMDASGFQPWKNGSAECRRAVRGKVVAVNEKFGYIGIDLGTDTLVRQPLGGKSVEVNPEIKVGMVMYITRNAGDAEKIDYIGKVKLTTVDTDTSIAEAVELAPDRKIQVGDIVFMEDGISVAPKAAK
ncbi:MAG: hypothetical protein IKZ31_01740 [Lentisphaeria bacterium]|nr:hypothetical protein [Lentisphaeria bacterium]